MRVLPQALAASILAVLALYPHSISAQSTSEMLQQYIDQKREDLGWRAYEDLVICQSRVSQGEIMQSYHDRPASLDGVGYERGRRGRAHPLWSRPTSNGRMLFWYEVRNRCPTEVTVEFRTEPVLTHRERPIYEKLRVLPHRTQKSWTYILRVVGASVVDVREASRSPVRHHYQHPLRTSQKAQAQCPH